MRSEPTLPARTPAEIADSGKIRTGMGFKLPPLAKLPVEIVDSGKIRTGMGFKLFAAPARRAR